MTSLEKAILSTFCYADVFDYPLTEGEIWRYLIGQKTTLFVFRKTLLTLLHKRYIFQKGTFYYLKGRSKIVVLRQVRTKIAARKLKIAQKRARLLSIIPTTRMVGLSGSLAMNNTSKADDIDFFIITSPGQLWTTRLLCALLLDVFHTRRKPGENKVKDKICINMFMDAASLTLPKKEQDLYGAHEVAQLKPLINKTQMYELFLHKNRWAKKYLPHAFSIPKLKKTFPTQQGRVVALIESLCKRLQLRYMRSKRTREVVSDRLLKFHPQDARERVMREYVKKTRLTSIL